MRIVITGATGQLGSALCRVLAEKTIIPLDLPGCDLTRSDVESQVVEACPDVVIHAGAYTDVDGAEREPERATAVNLTGTERVVAAAARVGARVLYLSTDYVFDGTQRLPYGEQDSPHPINHYGWTKWKGEQAVLSSGTKALVIRTAWLYGHQGKNFVTSIMRAAREQSTLRVVHDQRGCPTYVEDLAKTVASLLSPDVTGILHDTNGGDCSWHEFAQAIVEEMGLPVPVLPITTSEAGRLAKRPPYSVLSLNRLTSLSLGLPHWKEALNRFLSLHRTAFAATR